jgi:hypothetical protein
LAGIGSLPDEHPVKYWVVAEGRGNSFKLETLDWWDDASMHRHVHGVEVDDE